MARTSLQITPEVSHNLGVLADHEDRNKKDEIAFLVKDRMKTLNLVYTTKVSKRKEKEVAAN